MAGADPTALRLCVIGDSASVHVQGRTRPFTAPDFSLQIMDATPGPGLGALLRHAWHLARCPADIVHIHYAASVGAWLWLALGRRQPLVLTVMGGDILDDEQMRLPALARWMTRHVALQADIVTAKTDHLARRLTDMGVTPQRIVKLMWGVDRNRFRRTNATVLRESLGLASLHKMILSPRILRPFYNIHIILDALPAILAAQPRARLVLTEYCADPDYRAALVARAEALAISHAVIWAGTVAQERMADFYSAADVVVGIPPSDGFPQTILEALACGAPCVVTDMDRIREVIADEQTALLVHPETSAVARAVTRLLTDPALAARLAQAGPPLVAQKADLAQDLARMATLYRDLARRPPSPPRPFWVRASIGAILLGWMVRNALTRRHRCAA